MALASDKVLIPEIWDPIIPPSFITVVLNHLLWFSYVAHCDCVVNCTLYHVKLILLQAFISLAGVRFAFMEKQQQSSKDVRKGVTEGPKAILCMQTQSTNSSPDVTLLPSNSKLGSTKQIQLQYPWSLREWDIKNHGMSTPVIMVFHDTHFQRKISMSSQRLHYTHSVSNPILY